MPSDPLSAHAVGTLLLLPQLLPGSIRLSGCQVVELLKMPQPLTLFVGPWRPFGIDPDCHTLHSYLLLFFFWRLCRLASCPLAALEHTSAATDSKRIDLPLFGFGGPVSIYRRI